jgi:ribosomal protein S18 acetylase RimI-like enzyme
VSGNLQIVEADFRLSAHRDSILRLLDVYARGEMGLGRPLSDAVRAELVTGLDRHPTRLAFLAQLPSQCVGLAVCFLGYSTFAARPLVNIHDLIVDPGFRRQGIAARLLEAVESKARELGCCKVTLEVRVDNGPARSLYAQQGFASGPPAYEFWSRPLEAM